MIEPISATAAAAMKEAVKVAVKEVGKEVVKKSSKEILKAKAKELAIRGGNELLKEVAETVETLINESFKKDGNSETVAGRLVSKSVNKAINKIPLEKGINKLFEGSKFNTSAVKQSLAEKGIKASVFTGKGSVEKAFKQIDGFKTHAFIIKGSEELQSFNSKLIEFAEKNNCKIIPEKEFYIFGARNTEDLFSKGPIVRTTEAIPETLECCKNIRTEDLVRAEMPIDYAVEVSLKPRVNEISSMTEVGKLSTSELDPKLVNPLKKMLGCKNIDSARSWINGKNVADIDKRYFTPGDIRDRTKAIEAIGYKEYLLAKHETPNLLNSLITARSEKFSEARKLGPGSIDASLTQIKKNASGEFARQLIADTYKPYFESCEFEKPLKVGQSFTKADVFLSGAKTPFLAKEVYVPKGGTLAIEVKSGTKSHLLSQKEHLQFQAGSSKYVDASITVVTKDIMDMSKVSTEKLRAPLRKIAPVFKHLPLKEVLDKNITEYISALSSM